VRWSQYLAIVWQQESLPEGSSEPLGTQVTENEDECDEVNVSPVATIRTPEDNGATTSMPKPKKAKTSRNEKEGGLIGTFKGVGEILVDAIIKSTIVASDVPPDLYSTLQSLPGFDESHVDDYFDYFVENHSKARAYMQLSFDRKLSRFANFISGQEK
jgi:hypothetical protein